MPRRRPMVVWRCPKCGFVMEQPESVHRVSHDCPKSDPYVLVTLEPVMPRKA